jgi:vanillate O-demethylase ferredoxin subunit
MMKLRVRSLTWEAEGILSFELVHPEGQPLPAFEAGAHIDVRIPGGLSRRYSLCNAPDDRTHYRIAVLRVPESRGGSRAMHERVRAGDLIEVSEPRNFFPLDSGTGRAVLLAGGIGITPLLSMLDQLQAGGRPFEMHYCSTSPERTAFVQRLRPLAVQGLVTHHHDRGDPRNGLDIVRLLSDPAPGTHLYYCGPAGFMKAVKAASAHWPAGTVHFEHFGAEPLAAPTEVAATADTVPVRLLRSGRTVQVSPVQTLLQALREAGVDCESSCEAGVCGTCQVDYSEGEPEHNDLILNEEERTRSVLLCCARARTPLSLDL